MCKLAVLIASYNRSELFKKTLKGWLDREEIDTLIVKADSPKREEYEGYKEALEEIKSKSVVYEISDKRSGSAKAKNRVLEMALQNDCRFMICADDDHYIPTESDVKGSLKILVNGSIGAAGGKVVNLGNRAADPGGNRVVSLSRRILGKSKANTYFSFKWYSKPKAVWYVLVSSVILMLYSSNNALEVMKG
jgi:GT2 family glycosyltransferase